MENIINTVGYSKSPRCLGYRYLAYPLLIHGQCGPARQPDSPGTAIGTDTDRGLHGPGASQRDNQRDTKLRHQHTLRDRIFATYVSPEKTPLQVGIAQRNTLPDAAQPVRSQLYPFSGR